MVDRARLYPVVGPSPGETATSWISRLARLHNTSSRFFCLDMGVSLSAVALGDSEAIEKIARLAGVPFEVATDFAIRKSSDATYLLRWQKLTKSGLSRERVRVCPICLRSDIAEAILVNIDEVRAHVELGTPDAVSIHELTKQWKTTSGAIKALIAAGHLSLIVVLNPKNRCPMNAIPNADVAAFRATYVALMELAALRGMHHLKAKGLLTEHGVRAPLDPGAFFVTYFNRAEALNATTPK